MNKLELETDIEESRREGMSKTVAQIRERLMREDGCQDAENYDDLLWCIGEIERLQSDCAVLRDQMQRVRAYIGRLKEQPGGLCDAMAEDLLGCFAQPVTGPTYYFSSPLCNHDLDDINKTLKATLAPRYGWRCTVCKGEWYP